MAAGLWLLADGYFSDPNHHLGDAHLSQSLRVLDATNTRLIGVAHGRFLPRTASLEAVRRACNSNLSCHPNLPRTIYGHSTQMHRAAVSVASNSAQGKGRSADKEFALFLYHARGSLLELETQIVIARRTRLPASSRSRPPGRENRTISQDNQCAVECRTRRAREQARNNREGSPCEQQTSKAGQAMET